MGGLSIRYMFQMGDSKLGFTLVGLLSLPFWPEEKLHSHILLPLVNILLLELGGVWGFPTMQ